MTASTEASGPPLLCWDDSDSAAAAIRGLASILPEPRRATLVFAYLPSESGGGILPRIAASNAPRLTSAEAEAAVARGVQAAAEAGIEATGVAVAGDAAAEAIIAIADERRASMIVLGQGPRSQLSRTLLGSVARDVVRDTHQPVILVGGPTDGPAESEADPVNSSEVEDDASLDGAVLLCWDGSDGARDAIRDARAIHGAKSAIVLFAHVPTEMARGVLAGTSGPDAPIMGEPDAKAIVVAGLKAAREAGYDAIPYRVVADRKTGDIIAAVAERHSVPLIAMGQRKRSALGTLVLGSVARDVLARQHRPVLLGGPESHAYYPQSR
jgi:nucleotide-binding universal stress UspA family protein